MVRCSEEVGSIAFDLYIDPSGFVRTTAGEPISGASVTVLRGESAVGPFVVVPDGSAILSPLNRRNPSQSGPDGAFGWDVVAGVYQVRAEKAGCTDPQDPGRPFVESPPLFIPPAALNLDLRLSCPGAQADAAARGARPLQ